MMFVRNKMKCSTRRTVRIATLAHEIGNGSSRSRAHHEAAESQRHPKQIVIKTPSSYTTVIRRIDPVRPIDSVLECRAVGVRYNLQRSTTLPRPSQCPFAAAVKTPTRLSFSLFRQKMCAAERTVRVWRCQRISRPPWFAECRGKISGRSVRTLRRHVTRRGPGWSVVGPAGNLPIFT